MVYEPLLVKVAQKTTFRKVVQKTTFSHLNRTIFAPPFLKVVFIYQESNPIPRRLILHNEI